MIYFAIGTLSIIYIYLCANVITARRKTKIAFGDGNNIDMQRALAAHRNFFEYTSFTLVILSFVHYHSNAEPILNLFMILLVISRLLHAYGILIEEAINKKPKRICRMISISMSIFIIFGLTIILFLQSFSII